MTKKISFQHFSKSDIIYTMKHIRQKLISGKNDRRTEKSTKQDIVNYLHQNIHQQTRIEFYTHLDLQELEELLTISFRENHLNQEIKFFLINLLKKNTFILNIALNNEKFNMTALFQFIRIQQFSYETLNAFEDIFLPVCKKNSSKILSLLSNNLEIKKTLLNHIYTKQLFKILYTTVFCLSETSFIESKETAVEITAALTNSVFLYSPIPVDKSRKLKGLNYNQITLNLKDFLQDLTINLQEVDLVLVQNFIANIGPSFILKLSNYFSKLSDQEQFEQYCQGIIIIQINILKLLEKFKFSIENLGPQPIRKKKTQIQVSLCEIAVEMGKNINFFVSFLLQKSRKTLNYSSGQRIETVGLLKYRILELIEKLLSINEIQNLMIDFQKFNFIEVIECFILSYKWNNISHHLLFKIFQLIISQDYTNFRKRYLEDMNNLSKSLFGNLIMNFRNKKYIFLHSMRMINQGNRHFIFQISKALINELREKNDLNKLMDNFKVWKQFMLQDMKEYEISNYQISVEFDMAFEKEDKAKVKFVKDQEPLSSASSSQHRYSNKSLETIQQILKHLIEEQKWSPKISDNKMKKEELLQHQSFKQIDSLSSFFLKKT